MVDHPDMQYIDAIIKGIEARDKNLNLTQQEKNAKQLVVIKQRELLAQNNLKISEEWLLKKSEDKSSVLSCL